MTRGEDDVTREKDGRGVTVHKDIGMPEPEIDRRMNEWRGGQLGHQVGGQRTDEVTTGLWLGTVVAAAAPPILW
jgi:hypothetical protein